MEEEIELIPVEGHTTLGRDPVSNAILNTDTTQYDAYIKARENAKSCLLYTSDAADDC